MTARKKAVRRPARKRTPQPKPQPSPVAPSEREPSWAAVGGTLASFAVVIAVVLILSSRGCEIDLTPDPQPDPKPPVVKLDPLAKSHLADRSSKIRILRDMAGKMQAGEFQTDQQQADWWNKAIDDARREDFRPFVDATAEAIVDDKVSEFADRLEVQP